MVAAHVSPYGGTWYPLQQRRLNVLFDELFEGSCCRTGPCVLRGALAGLVPHAAPRYSGTVAAAVYRHVQAVKPERVFILGFNHAGGSRDVSVPNVERYRTPLGEIAVDTSCTRALSAVPFQLVPESETCDHSVEIQLPFLQRVAPTVRVVPLCVGQLGETQRTAAAEVLARVWRPGDFILASSDLTHYGTRFGCVPFPVDSQVARRLRELDRAVLDGASSIDCGLFLDTLRKSAATPCGLQPLLLLLRTLSLMDSDTIFQQELDYQTSGEISGDFSESVSYAAACYFRKNSFEVNAAEQHELLVSAQATLERLRQTGQREVVSLRSIPAFERCAPIFMTLTYQGHVIGCIGHVFRYMPLAEAVPRLTMEVALDDPRRLPDDRIPPNINIEISLLTPMKLVRSADAVRIGRNGVYLEWGAHRSLLLPQVAGADWTTTRFLDLLFQKAGLRRQLHDDPQRRLYIFEAQVFRS